MEQIHAELVRFDGEIDVVGAHVQTVCPSLWDFHTSYSAFATESWPTEPQSIGKGLPQQYGNRVENADFTFSCGAVYVNSVTRWARWSDAERCRQLRQGGQVRQGHCACSTLCGGSGQHPDIRQRNGLGHVHPRRRGHKLVRRVRADPNKRLDCRCAVAQWFRRRSVVQQAASMARLMTPKRTKNAGELQIAVKTWELLSRSSQKQCWTARRQLRGGPCSSRTHSKASSTCFPTTKSSTRGLSAYVGGKLAGKVANAALRPMNTGQIAHPNEGDDDITPTAQTSQPEAEADSVREAACRWPPASTPPTG